MFFDKEKLNKIKNQIEYYLSDENLKKDLFFIKLFHLRKMGILILTIF
jgi:hypothetical protein